MLGVVFSLAEALNVGWSVLADQTASSLKEKLRRFQFRRSVVKRARAALKTRGTVDAAAARDLLSDPQFVDFALDPQNQAKQDALDPKVIQRLAGPDTSGENVAKVLAIALIQAAYEQASAEGQIADARLAKIDTTVSQALEAVLGLPSQIAGLQSAVAGIADRLLPTLRDLLDGDPFLASEVNLSQFRMSSDVTGDDVPPYVARDIDNILNERVAQALSGDGNRLVVVAGQVKVGKTRCLLEALRRVAPHGLVLRIRHTRGTDPLADVLEILRSGPLSNPWIVLIDDLADYLRGGHVNLARAVRLASVSNPPGLIAATMSDDILDLTDNQRRMARIADEDIELITHACIVLPPAASPAEQGRAQTVYAHELSRGAIEQSDLPHFPERLAAVPQLRSYVAHAMSGRPTVSPQAAMIIAACQIAYGQATRVISREELHGRAKRIHESFRPVERQTSDLSNTELQRAEKWAGERVGAAYAALLPAEHSPRHVVLADAVLDTFGYRALDPQFGHCVEVTSEAIALGIRADTHEDPPTAAYWTRRAVELGDSAFMPMAAFNLGVLEFEAGNLEIAKSCFERAFASGDVHAASHAANRLGLMAYESGDGEAARAWWATTTSFQQPEAVAAATFNLALAEDRDGNIDLARIGYCATLRSGVEPITSCAAVNLGILESKAGAVGMASRWFDLAYAKGNQEQAPRSAFHRATMELDSGNRYWAIRWFQLAFESDHPYFSVMSATILGTSFYTTGHIEAARHWFQLAIGAKNNLSIQDGIAKPFWVQRTGTSPADTREKLVDWAAPVNLAVLEHEAGNADVARRLLAPLVESDPPVPKAVLTLAIVEAENGNLEAARDYYERAAGLGDAENSPAAALNLASLERSAGNDEAARQWYEFVIESDDATYGPRAALRLAELEDDAGNLTQARHWFELAASSAAPEVAGNAAYNAASIAHHQGDLDSARKLMKLAASVGNLSSASRASMALTELEARAGDLDEARFWFQKGIEAGATSDTPRAAFVLAEHERRAGNSDLAARLYSYIADSDDENYALKALLNLATLVLRSGDVGFAHDAFTSIFRSGRLPEAAYAAVNLGRIEERRGNADAARTFYHRALDLGVDEASTAANVGLDRLNDQMD